MHRPLWEMADSGFIRLERRTPQEEKRKEVGVQLGKALMKAKA